MEKDIALGKFLKEARMKIGLSLRAVESQTSVSNAYLSQVESGKVKQPSPVVLHSLSILYQISYSDLMILAGYPVPEKNKYNPRDRRILARFSNISAEEEDALSEYLSFLRSRMPTGSK